MRFGVFDNYGAKNSAPVFDAFRQGVRALSLSASAHDLNADVAVIWSMVWAGRMKMNQMIWQTFRSSGRPVIVLEIGLLQRGLTWKMGINGTGSSAHWGQGKDPNRAKKLDIALSPWRKDGEHILIAMQRTDSEQWDGMPRAEIWLNQLVGTLRQNTKRPILVRPHPRQKIVIPETCRLQMPEKISNTYDDFDYDHGLKNAWAVINWNSGPGPISVIKGIPAFVGHSSLAAPVANLDFDLIENPRMPDRDSWALDLAHTEWTLEEIATGLPLERLLPFLQSR